MDLLARQFSGSIQHFAGENGLFSRPLEKRKPDPKDVAVGRKIRARRLFMGMTQPALAEAVGVTYQQIQKYENWP
ncbi:helix-turn-helix transcriptional regulator [Ensifer aridi]|uniref:helix-turn-helix transcriptional regulator n=1 Tax=Ensifer aridi TaxID=1708715 RepID=UPI00111C1B40|nr:helix-turn-helix transcriptional regulator [Ensifer aridi]